MSVIYNNKPILPIGKPMPTPKPAGDNSINKGTSFGAVFQEELSRQSEVKFSKHAMERLQTRNIKLSKEDLNKINEAVNKAAEKGVKETLIIMGNSAFIANVKSKTIITAATEDNLKNNVFTNIDGAVII
jgi:flagellar operon protein